MKHILKKMDGFQANYLVIFWVLSIFFILSFIATMMSIFLVSRPGSNAIILMERCILSVIITFAGIIFLRNWIKAYKKNEEISNKKDYGLAFLAGAMLCWSFNICFDVLWDMPKFFGPIFSALNSICFLFAIEYFDSIQEGKTPKLLLRLGINSGRYKSNVSAYVFSILMLMLGLIFIAGNPSFTLMNGALRFSWSGIIDAVFLGLLTLYVLFQTLIKTWRSRIRKDNWMVVLTVIVLSFTLVMQFVNASAPEASVAYAVSAVLYRVLLIMIFYGIAFSWTYSLFVKQNEELNKVQAELILRNAELEFAHKNMRHGILNNVLILKMDLDDTLTALKNLRNVPEREDYLQAVTEIFNRYDFLLQISRLLYSPDEEYSDHAFFVKLMELVKEVLNLKENEFKRTIEINKSLTKSANQQRDFGIIAYELITNAKKYGSNEVEVELSGKEAQIVLKVKDRGPNYFDIEAAKNAGKLRGLKSVLRRIEYYKGSYCTQANLPGTIFSVVLPI